MISIPSRNTNSTPLIYNNPEVSNDFLAQKDKKKLRIVAGMLPFPRLPEERLFQTVLVQIRRCLNS